MTKTSALPVDRRGTDAASEGRPVSSGLDASLTLDVLRGMAAVFMIVNHVGTHWLPNAVAHGVGRGAFFVSSAAPVLFFFVTGVAGALRKPTGPWWGRWRTVACLVVAELFFAWQQSEVWTLDFFGFIALATVVVDIVARLSRPMTWAAGLALLLLFIGYVVQPSVLRATTDTPWLAWFVGVPLPRVSYPLTPWLCYPLIGIVVGRSCARPPDVDGAPTPLRRWPAVPVVLGLTLLSLGSLSLARLLVRHGAHVNRWSYVTPGYFVYSVSILAGAIAASAVIALASRRLAALLSLRGVAAYAVVPMHYGLLAAGMLAGLVVVDDAGYALAAGCVLVAAFWLSERYADGVRRVVDTRWARPASLAVAVTCGVVLWTIDWPHPGLQWMGVVVLGQLCAGVWLVAAPKHAGRTR